MKVKLTPETLEALAKISKAAGGTGAMHVTTARTCDNCQDDDKDAFPYGVYDKAGKYWEDLCNECFDLLGCSYPDQQEENMETPIDDLRTSYSAMARELAITRAALAEIRRFNRLKNDLDAYLYEVANYGLGQRQDAPLPSEYGLDQDINHIAN